MALIAYELADQVAKITITREEALNALSREVLTELDAALDQVVDHRLHLPGQLPQAEQRLVDRGVELGR